jgi:type IV pilus assembly protein PilC
MPTARLDHSLFPSPGAVSDRYGNASTDASPLENEGLQWSPTESRRTNSRRKYGHSIRKQDVAEITSQLAIMTRSGVDIASALGSLASQCQREALASVLGNVHESVLSGCTLSDALRHHTEVFEPGFIATVAAGEASGQMSDVLAQSAQMQRNEIRSRRTIRAMMTYPVLLMMVSSAVLVALVLFVLPRFADIFTQYDIALPAITQLLIAIADELWAHWWLWGPLVLITVIGMLLWRKTEQGRRSIDTLLINAPVVRHVYCSQLIGRTCRLMGLMLQSGVPLVESLSLAREAIGNTLYKDLLSNLEEAVLNGNNLESVLKTTEVIPQSAREMIITAEGTGKLGEVTQLLGEYYEEEAESGMRQLVGLLEPIITVGMGVLVAGVVLAVMLPIFDLSTLSHGGH